MPPINEKPICHRCERQYSNQYSLERHYRNVHKVTGVVYHCRVENCSFNSPDPTSLLDHVERFCKSRFDERRIVHQSFAMKYPQVFENFNYIKLESTNKKTSERKARNEFLKACEDGVIEKKTAALSLLSLENSSLQVPRREMGKSNDKSVQEQAQNIQGVVRVFYVNVGTPPVRDRQIPHQLNAAFHSNNPETPILGINLKCEETLAPELREDDSCLPIGRDGAKASLKRSNGGETSVKRRRTQDSEQALHPNIPEVPLEGINLNCEESFGSDFS